jgi:hypothetical protein
MACTETGGNVHIKSPRLQVREALKSVEYCQEFLSLFLCGFVPTFSPPSWNYYILSVCSTASFFFRPVWLKLAGNVQIGSQYRPFEALF